MSTPDLLLRVSIKVNNDGPRQASEKIIEAIENIEHPDFDVVGVEWVKVWEPGIDVSVVTNEFGHDTITVNLK